MGIIVRKYLLPLVKSFEPVNDRICYVIQEGKYFDVAIISFYGPTEENKIKEKDNLYEELEDAYERLFRHCIKIFMGNFNAKIEQKSMYRSTISEDNLHKIINDNGT